MNNGDITVDESGYGYVEWKGERFSYREVDWDEDRHRLACVKANRLGGAFNYDMIANDYTDIELVEVGFDAVEFIAVQPDKDDKEFSNRFKFTIEFESEVDMMLAKDQIYGIIKSYNNTKIT